MRASIVMSTRNKPNILKQVLKSIYRQEPCFDFETIIVDDGSENKNVEAVCGEFPVKYIRIENPSYRNPAFARNIGYREARGEVVIAQSDDVIHVTTDAIKRLTYALRQNEFIIATVWNYKNGKKHRLYTGLKNRRPLFFLGSLWRRDLYAIGGNEEQFTAPGYDDDFFAACLKGLGRKARYHPGVIGYHLHHGRPRNLRRLVVPSRQLYRKLIAEFKAKGEPPVASDAPWEFM